MCLSYVWINKCIPLSEVVCSTPYRNLGFGLRSNRPEKTVSRQRPAPPVFARTLGGIHTTSLNDAFLQTCSCH